MDFRTAAAICHPQDETLALAEKLTGEAAQREAREIAEAGVPVAYRVAANELERIAINLRAYCRGMVGAQVVPSYIKQAREALDAMEVAVTP